MVMLFIFDGMIVQTSNWLCNSRVWHFDQTGETTLRLVKLVFSSMWANAVENLVCYFYKWIVFGKHKTCWTEDCSRAKVASIVIHVCCFNKRLHSMLLLKFLVSANISLLWSAWSGPRIQGKNACYSGYFHIQHSSRFY